MLKTTGMKRFPKLKVNDDNPMRKSKFFIQLFITACWRSKPARMSMAGISGWTKSITVEEGDFYPSFSCWDTYRTEHPLMTIIAPEHVNDMIKSIVAKTKNYGWLPAQHFRNEFGQGMVGDHLIPIIVDAYIKGYQGF
jgi:putative alpha-1,2-mannosidase